MKRIIVLVAVILAGFVLLRISGASVADSNVPDNETTTSASEVDNSSAGATITITMTTASLAGE